MSGTLGQSVAGGGGNTRGPRSPPIIVVTRWTNDRGSGLTSTDKYWMGMPSSSRGTTAAPDRTASETSAP